MAPIPSNRLTGTRASVHGPTALALAVLTAAVPAQYRVSPADRDGLEGSSSTIYPLGRFDSRFQQLFDDLGKARAINGHAYRRDALASRGEIKAFKTWMTVDLSVAAVAAAQISNTFANNSGASPTRVLPRTLVSFPTTGKPTTVPAAFELVVPYAKTWLWPGAGTLCLDMTIDGNELSTGSNRTFSASLDAHELYASGRNTVPGYPFGSGCPAPGRSRAAAVDFEVRHLGASLDLSIDARDGVPSDASGAGFSALLLGATRLSIPWPPGSGCTLYSDATVLLPLPGANTAAGDWKGVVPAGAPPAPGFEVIGQILSHGAAGAVALSDAARLIAPPPGAGVVSSRVVSGSDRTAATGSVSFIVPVTGFR